MDDKRKPWIRIYDQWGDPSGRIVGNASGLKELQRRIELAINEEVTSVSDLDCDFEEVRRDDKRPDDQENGPKGKTDYGCLILLGVLAIILLGIFALGVLKLFELRSS